MCQKISLSLFGVCLFFRGFWCIEKLGLPPEEKILAGRLGLDPLLTLLMPLKPIRLTRLIWLISLARLTRPLPMKPTRLRPMKPTRLSKPMQSTRPMCPKRPM